MGYLRVCYIIYAMANEKPLTKSDLVSVIKEMGVATKEDVTQSEKRLRRFIRAEIRSVRADVAKRATDTPTRGEFNKLKEHVERYCSAI